jgi:hypothetical protein
MEGISTMTDNAFVTSSLPLAAYVIASRSLRLREIKLTDPRRAVFVFEDEQGRGPELDKAFLDGSAVVSAFSFHRQLRALRRAIDEKIFAARSGVNGQNQSTRIKENVSHANQH